MCWLWSSVLWCWSLTLAIQCLRPPDKEQNPCAKLPGPWERGIYIPWSFPHPFLLSSDSRCGHRMPVTSFCAKPSPLLSGFLYSFRDSSCCQPAHSTILRSLREQLELSQGLILHHWVWYQIFLTYGKYGKYIKEIPLTIGSSKIDQILWELPIQFIFILLNQFREVFSVLMYRDFLKPKVRSQIRFTHWKMQLSCVGRGNSPASL